MAGISEQDIERVREAIDFAAIVSSTVSLRPKGSELWGCCPFHTEKSPSFKISPDTKRWHCFGACSEGGDVFSYLMKRDNITFPEAVEECARIAGVSITRDAHVRKETGKKNRLKQVCSEAALFYHTQLKTLKDPAAQSARDYLTKRGFSIEVAKRWDIGFAPGNQSLVRYLSSKGFSMQEMIDANVAAQSNGSRAVRDRFFNRIMFPICDVEGNPIAFGGRVIGAGEPKYLNSQETLLFHKSNVLFGMDKAKAHMASTGEAIIVEGYTDVISLHEAGIQNVVATLGTSLTVQHIRLLSRHAKRRIIYLFDGDEAGMRAADRAARLIDDQMLPEAGRGQVELFAVTLPEGLDPADFVAQRGSEALAELIAREAKPLLEYAIRRIVARHNVKDYTEQTRALREMLDMLAPIKDSLYAKTYAELGATILQMDVQEVLGRLAKIPKPQRRNDVFTSQNKENNSQTPAQTSVAQQPLMLSSKQKNRLQLEGQFLYICATQPQLGILWQQWLSAFQWHRNIHRRCAQYLQEIFSEGEVSTNPAQIMAKLVEKDGALQDFFARQSSLTSYKNPDSALKYIAEELQIGDLEAYIDDLKAQAKTAQDSDDGLWAKISEYQTNLEQMRANHASL